MKKEEILKSSRDFTRIIKKNNIFKHKCFYIFIEENNLDKYQVGISVPTKIGNAVVRNKIKRRIKSIMSLNKNLLSDKYNYVILIRKEILNNEYSKIENNMIYCLSKLKEKINE